MRLYSRWFYTGGIPNRYELWELPTNRLIQFQTQCINKANSAHERWIILTMFKSNKKDTRNRFLHKELRQWKLRDRMIQRERNYRINSVAYRGFINKIIHDPRNKIIHLLAFADWLEEHGGNPLQSRRVKQWVERNTK